MSEKKAAKIGRPRRAGKVAGKLLAIRLTDEEFKLVSERAGAAGLPPSAWVRYVALNGRKPGRKK